MRSDRQGHALSGSNSQAARHYDAAIAQFGIYRGDPLAELDEALSVAPACVLALLVKAWLMGMATEPAAAAEARKLLEAARRLPMDERETAHADALSRLDSRHRTATGTGFCGLLARGLPQRCGASVPFALHRQPIGRQPRAARCDRLDANRGRTARRPEGPGKRPVPRAHGAQAAQPLESPSPRTRATGLIGPMRKRHANPETQRNPRRISRPLGILQPRCAERVQGLVLARERFPRSPAVRMNTGVWPT